MAGSAPTRQTIRFGTYELNPRAGELRKSGIKIKVQEQPFQVLVALLERPGEVVTREELREKLWPDHTFVDFDQGLNTAINKIREALIDSAANPRFVETVPRRGYRFIAPVELPKPPPQSPDATAAPKPRAPVRPNPISLSVCRILSVEGTTVRIAGIDADDGTPIIDL